MSQGKSVLSASLINTAAGSLSLAAGFGSSVIVARLLGVEGAGIVAYALWIMTVATLLSDFGMPQAALRFIAGDVEAGDSRSKLFTALTNRFVVTTGIMAAGILGYALWLYMDNEGGSALVWAATTALFLSYAYSTMATGAAHGLGQFRRAADRTTIGGIVQPIAILAGALLIGPAGAILGHAARHLPQGLALRRYLSKAPLSASHIAPAMKTYARHNWLSSLAYILGSRVELAIIGWSFSIVAVGYYAIGITMVSLVIQLSMFLAASLVPYFGVLHDGNDIESLTVGYQRSLRWLGLALSPICFGGAAIAPVLIPSLFGAQFEPGVDAAEVLLVFSFAVALAAVPERMMLARERSLGVLKLSILWGGVSVALMLAIVPHFAGLGAAWVKGVIAIAALVSLLWYCHRRLAIPCIPMDLVKIVAAGLLAGLAARLCIYWMPGLGGMVLGIAAGAVVYPASVLLFSALSADDKALIGAWASANLPARIRQRLPISDAALQQR